MSPKIVFVGSEFESLVAFSLIWSMHRLVVTSLLISLALSSCASILTSADKVKIDAPTDISVSLTDGTPLDMRLEDDGLQSVIVSKLGNDTIIIHKGDVSRTIKLQRVFNGYTLINLYNCGIGFLVDDATHALVRYEPVHVSPDLKLTPLPFPLSTFFNMDRPRLVLFAGWGYNSDPHLEYGGGLSYKCFALLARAELDIGTDPFNFQRYDMSFNISTATAQARFYTFKGLFLAAEYGTIRFQDDNTSASKDSLGLSHASSRVLGGGVGWSGDIAYFEVRYLTALGKVQLYNFPARNYHHLLWSWGIHLTI